MQAHMEGHDISIQLSIPRKEFLIYHFPTENNKIFCT